MIKPWSFNEDDRLLILLRKRLRNKIKIYSFDTIETMGKNLEIFKSNLNFVRTVYAQFMKSRDSANIEAIVFLGFNFIILNKVHTTIAYKNLENLIRTFDLGCIVPIVRAQNLEKHI